jgi:hypothetical protein
MATDAALDAGEEGSDGFEDATLETGGSADEAAATEDAADATGETELLLAEELSSNRICSTRMMVPPSSTVGRMDPVTSTDSPT